MFFSQEEIFKELNKSFEGGSAQHPGLKQGPALILVYDSHNICVKSEWWNKINEVISEILPLWCKMRPDSEKIMMCIALMAEGERYSLCEYHKSGAPLVNTFLL